MMKIIGKIESINKGAHFSNTTIILEDKTRANIKLDLVDEKDLQIGKVYVFDVEEFYREDVLNYRALKYMTVEDAGFSKEKLTEFWNSFYDYAPIPISEIKKGIESYLNRIDNKVLKDITKDIYQKFEDKYYLHPAATKFHHAYVGGLSYHTLTMLKLIEPMLNVYTYLNKDLLYAATILHDISKIDEMTGVDGEYTKEGVLIGHLVMGSIEVEMSALKLGYQDTEEVLLLKHLILSHHGQLTFGSPKKPQTAEALLLWFVDTMDSKFRELGDELEKIEPGEFTQAIAVLDKMKFYKPKL
ncbi:HD domain-containing protein [Acholeplasma equifetale]|uniref:HD domain-containing protein n=1 Tax=Acholeplasma equifetale TaxID=264634 RepID=UPI0006904103|nr:HD domain-containing protein [Acholeplasma equifetale]